MGEKLRITHKTMTFPPKKITMHYGQPTKSKSIQTFEAGTLSSMVDVTNPKVRINGEELNDIQPDVTTQELLDHFAPNTHTRSRMVHVQCLQAYLHKASKGISDFDTKEQRFLDDEYKLYSAVAHTLISFLTCPTCNFERLKEFLVV